MEQGPYNLTAIFTTTPALIIKRHEPHEHGV